MHPGVFAAMTPDKAALVMGATGERISYRELDDRANRLAQLLYDRGLRPGDGVALLAENHRRYFEVYWAALRSGLDLTAVNRYLAPDEAVAAHPVTPLAKRTRGDVMLYSSGTTGRPKGIRRPLTGAEVDDPAFIGISGLERGLLGMSEASVYLCPAPLYHPAALQWSAGLHEMGATVVVMERFDAGRFLELAERERVTHSTGLARSSASTTPAPRAAA
jgi:long-chain acyl-CoA synthetase